MESCSVDSSEGALRAHIKNICSLTFSLYFSFCLEFDSTHVTQLAKWVKTSKENHRTSRRFRIIFPFSSYNKYKDIAGDFMSQKHFHVRKLSIYQFFFIYLIMPEKKLIFKALILTKKSRII